MLVADSMDKCMNEQMVTFKILSLELICEFQNLLGTTEAFSISPYFQSCHWCPVLHRVLPALPRRKMTAPCFESMLWTPNSGPRATLVQWQRVPTAWPSGMHTVETGQLRSVGPSFTVEGHKLIETCYPHF